MTKLAVTIENNQPIPPQRITKTTANYALLLQRLKPRQCFRIKNYDLYMRMRAAAHTQNSKHGAAYVCRWIGSFGRIWNNAKPAKRGKK